MGLVFFVLVCAAAPAFALDINLQLRLARSAYEFGRYTQVIDELAKIPDFGMFANEADRIDAWRLKGLAYYFQGDRAEAENALFGLLKQDPDYQLDPFYVPPDAVAFFDDVKTRSEGYLAPIRDRRRARLREQAREDAARSEADRLRATRLSNQPPVVVERQIQVNARALTLLPLGYGQFQNDESTKGTGFLVAEAAAGLTSVLMYGLIESLRDPTTRRFSQDSYKVAQNFEVVKLVSAGLFYGLWAVGAVEANYSFVPQRLVGETKTQATDLPAMPARPAGVEKPQAPEVPTKVTPPKVPGTGPDLRTIPLMPPNPLKTLGNSDEASGDPSASSETPPSTVATP